MRTLRTIAIIAGLLLAYRAIPYLVFHPPSLPRAAEATGDGITMLDVDGLAQIMSWASSAEVTAFVLPPQSTLGRAMRESCRSGKRFIVILDGRSFVRRENEAAIHAYRAAGCAADFARGELHMKLAYVDRRVYLSDTNFSRDGYVIADERQDDRDVIASTLRGRPTSNASFSTVKERSLRLEAQTIASAHHEALIETESFGPRNPASDALERAAGHVRIYLLVAHSEFERDQEEREYLHHLAARGVQVRVTPKTEKMAVADRLTAWLGSTNASPGVAQQVDWGLNVRNAAIAQALYTRFKHTWASAARF